MPPVSLTEPQALTTLADYQTGAIVSKELLRTTNGTVTFFAFDAGQGLSEHTAPFDVIAHIADGVADITISGQLHTVKAGEIIKMPANEPHALFARERFKMMLVMLKH